VAAFAQTTPTGVNRIDAEGRPSVSGPAVAVIDTGSGPHPDLNVVGGVNCSTGRSHADGNGHGTHVAGTIGALNNSQGVVGVAPGAPLYSVRVLNNSGSGTWASVICGIDWVTANAASRNIRIANMSLGGQGTDDGNCGNSNNDAMHRAICGSVAAGITYVVAAGNDGTNFAASVPAAYDEVLTVTAVADFNGLPGGGAAPTCRSDVDDSSAGFSNFTLPGSSDEGHAIAAPGVCIQSTWKGKGYATVSGTSMASPHVAGTALRCIASGAAREHRPASSRSFGATPQISRPLTGSRATPGIRSHQAARIRRPSSSVISSGRSTERRAPAVDGAGRRHGMRMRRESLARPAASFTAARTSMNGRAALIPSAVGS
jgi:hypothetical protein